MHVVSEMVSSGHVYVVEDDDDLRADMLRMFISRGYTVDAFSSAIEFIKSYKETFPAVIVTDMVLPEMSGVELQTFLLNSDRNLPFIFVSGQSSHRQIISAMKNGNVDFILKPFGREQLFSAVEKGLELDRNQSRARVLRADFLARFDCLSPREKQVCQLLAKGFDNQMLIRELGVSIHTAKQYKSEVMRKMNFSSLSELIENAKHSE